MSDMPLLAVEELSIEFRTRSGTVRALDRVGFELYRGETMALVGESGSGKSVTAYAMMGILDAAAHVTSGRIMFGGLELLHAGEKAAADIRGREMAIIFQNPRTALNPIRPVGKQIADILLRHANIPSAQAPRRAVEMLARVRIPDPERRAGSYPFELSGGMCQRVMIAMALACEPQVLIADEPTTGLDITTQAVIMDLIAELAGSRKMATLLITHDLALAAEYSDRIAVMHAGQVVETAPTLALFAAPRHPYTARLIGATPGAAPDLDAFTAIPGALPDLRREDLPLCRTVSDVSALPRTAAAIHCRGWLRTMGGRCSVVFRYDTRPTNAQGRWVAQAVSGRRAAVLVASRRAILPACG